MSHRLPVVHFESFSLQSLGLAIDAFAGGALVVNGMIVRAIAIKGDPYLLTQFPVDILDTPFAFGKLGVVAASAGWVRKEQWAAEALSAIAFGMLELVVRCMRKLLGHRGVKLLQFRGVVKV